MDDSNEAVSVERVDEVANQKVTSNELVEVETKQMAVKIINACTIFRGGR